MDKNELERRLEAAEKQMIGLQDEIQNLKTKLAEAQDEQEIPDFPEFKPTAGEAWHINNVLEVASTPSYYPLSVDDYNYFHTKEYAQEFADKCKLIAMMLHCKWYIDRDVLDTSEKTLLYGICYDKEKKKFVYASYCSCDPCTVTFITEEAAKKAADWLNKHWRGYDD